MVRDRSKLARGEGGGRFLNVLNFYSIYLKVSYIKGLFSIWILCGMAKSMENKVGMKPSVHS